MSFAESFINNGLFLATVAGMYWLFSVVPTMEMLGVAGIMLVASGLLFKVFGL